MIYQKRCTYYFGAAALIILEDNSNTQRRSKILPAAFQHLFHKFNETFSQTHFFHGYRLYAVDGSDIHIPTIPDDHSTHYNANVNSKGYNLIPHSFKAIIVSSLASSSSFLYSVYNSGIFQILDTSLIQFGYTTLALSSIFSNFSFV